MDGKKANDFKKILDLFFLCFLKQLLKNLDDNYREDMKEAKMLRKPLFFLFFFGTIFLAAAKSHAGQCLSVDGDACAVTNPAGDESNGTLISCLSDPRCQHITFAVSAVQPLQEYLEVAPGLTIDGSVGGGRITLTFAEDFALATTDPYYEDFCLVRIRTLPGAEGQERVRLGQLNIMNPHGDGICVLGNAETAPRDNVFENITVQGGSNKRGIDFGNSSDNLLENVEVVGVGSNAQDGIYQNGGRLRVRGGRIENFRYGVRLAGGSLASVSQVEYRRIRTRPIELTAFGTLGVSVSQFRPQSLRRAFVGPLDFTLTGLVHELATGLELYAVADADPGKDYTYKLTIPVTDILPEDTGFLYDSTRRDLRRFIELIQIGADALAADQDVAGVAFRGQEVTGEFSPTSSGGNAVHGHPRCNFPENRLWFWYSYDRAGCDGAGELTDPDCAWDWDFDGDNDDNGFEDTDQDCRLDLEESDPNDWRSQFDFDCDGRADHRFVGLTRTDNCINFNRPGCDPATDDDCEYQRNSVVDLLEAECSDVGAPDNVSRFASWNPEQVDSDGDGIGDACEADPDQDGLNNALDNCDTVSNPDQRDTDGDGEGDACERIEEAAGIGDAGDLDGDGLPNGADNCPGVPNRQQRDRDGDSLGDYCDHDQRRDADGDGRINVTDNCPFDFNPNQADRDEGGAGDACDADDDNDGLTDAEEVEAGTNPLHPDSDFDTVCDGPGWGFNQISCFRPGDNCPRINNSEQTDQDEDGIGDPCDANPTLFHGPVDSDGDGILDRIDNCPHLANPAQLDADSDSVGNPCDSDDDNDGLDDAAESEIFDPRRNQRGADLEPLIPASHLNHDVDSDNYYDGVDLCVNFPNPEENAANPSGSRTLLTDSDCGNYSPVDIDGDGRSNLNDNCVFISNPRQLDRDADGLGDACDLDDDNDDNTNTTTQLCWDHLRGLVADFLSGGGGGVLSEVVARNTFLFCNPALGNCRHCDYDESANYWLDPWDPNSDHEGGRIFGRADRRCDGSGTGFGAPTAQTRCEASDPCPEFFNPDGAEGVCGPAAASLGLSSPDFDVDGLPNAGDNCPELPNANQLDMNRNGIGDACDPDIDGDLVLNENDNCSLSVNPTQVDTDGDGLGDDCDPNPFSRAAAEIRGAGVTAGGCAALAGQASLPSPVFWLLLASLGFMLFSARKWP